MQVQTKEGRRALKRRLVRAGTGQLVSGPDPMQVLEPGSALDPCGNEREVIATDMRMSWLVRWMIFQAYNHFRISTRLHAQHRLILKKGGVVIDQEAATETAGVEGDHTPMPVAQPIGLAA